MGLLHVAALLQTPSVLSRSLVKSTTTWLSLEFGHNSCSVPKDHKQEISLSGIKYTDLLPQNRDYYHYEGSLTTPLCDETVQWFVLKHPIRVPGAYLDDLRKVEENAQGDFLTFNFRHSMAVKWRLRSAMMMILSVVLAWRMW